MDPTALLAGLEPHPRFADALAAFDAGDIDALGVLLADHPDLVHARTNLDPGHGYFAGATLLHHVAGNPWRDVDLPPSVLELARVLLDAGAEVDTATLGRNGGTTMGLVLTSRQASDRELSGPLIDLLRERGAALDVSSAASLRGSLANHAPRAAEKLIALGVVPDLFAAAGLGDLDLLRSFFRENGRLRERPLRDGVAVDERDAIGLAALFAYVRRQRTALDFLLAHDGNWNVTGVGNGTLLHRAAWDGDLPMVERLVALGADTHNRDNPFESTPLSWAQHNGQQGVTDWLRAHGAE